MNACWANLITTEYVAPFFIGLGNSSVTGRCGYEECSAKAHVVSVVPQGTVLGLLLFLLFINDLPSQVSPGTITLLFADDCLIYREITSDEAHVIFQ